MSSRTKYPKHPKHPKKYNVILEYLNISILSENLNYKTKTITLSKDIEYIPITIKHYQLINNDLSNTELPILEIINPALTHNDIIQYWKNISISNDVEKGEEQTDCSKSIVPLYIVGDILILGVVIIGIYNWKKYKLLETFNLLSRINNTTNSNTPKYNFILGIVNNPNCKELLKNKTLKIKNISENIPENIDMHISWYNVFLNFAGYFKKIKIVYKEKQNASINFFQNRLNP